MKMRRRQRKNAGIATETRNLILASIRKQGFNPLTLKNQTEEEFFRLEQEAIEAQEAIETQEAEENTPETEIPNISVDADELETEISNIFVEVEDESEEETEEINEPEDDEDESEEVEDESEETIIDLEDPSTWPAKNSEEWKQLTPSMKSKITFRRRKLND